jgi:rSAM/selenodomain-associated transferase 2
MKAPEVLGHHAPAEPNPQLSIVICTLNEAADIGVLLDQLQDLRKSRHEVVLVDGGSVDHTTRIARPLVDRLLNSPPGRATQLNMGARHASGDVLWFLHADSRVEQGSAQALLDSLAAGADWGRFDVRLSGQRWPLRMVETLINLRSRLTAIATGDQGIFVARETFEAAGGFEDIPLMEDVALSKSLRRSSAPACIGQPRLQTSSRRWEQHGILATILLMWRLRLAYALGASPHQLAKRYR